MSKTAKNILAAVLLIVLCCACFLAWKHFSPEASEGDKILSFTVTHLDGTVKTYSVETSAADLGTALTEEGIIEGEENEYGLYVTSVDGETADESENQWWCFTKGGEMLMTGVTDTMIQDGESYEAFIDTY